MWQTVSIFCRIAHALARPIESVYALGRSVRCVREKVGGKRAAIPAHTTRFRHVSLKSRWPPSSRSSSPPGACRSAIPPLRVLAAARRGRRSHDQASASLSRRTYSTLAAAREAGARASGSSHPSAAACARIDSRSEHGPAARDARFTDDPRLTDHAPSPSAFF